MIQHISVERSEAPNFNEFLDLNASSKPCSLTMSHLKSTLQFYFRVPHRVEMT